MPCGQAGEGECVRTGADQTLEPLTRYPVASEREIFSSKYSFESLASSPSFSQYIFQASADWKGKTRIIWKVHRTSLFCAYTDDRMCFVLQSAALKINHFQGNHRNRDPFHFMMINECWTNIQWDISLITINRIITFEKEILFHTYLYQKWYYSFNLSRQLT